MLRHDVPDDARIRLPLLLALLLVVAPKVLIGLKDRQLGYDHPVLKRNGRAGHEAGDGLNLDNAILVVECARLILNDLGLHGLQGEEGALLELKELLAVGRASLGVENKGGIEALGYQLLSLHDLLVHSALAVLAVSLDPQAPEHAGALTHKWNVLDTLFGHVRGRLRDHVDHYVQPARVVAHYCCCFLGSILSCLPVRSKVFAVVHIFPNYFYPSYS